MSKLKIDFGRTRKISLIAILIIQLIMPATFAQNSAQQPPRIGSLDHLENLVPNQEQLFGVKDEHLEDFHKNFPKELREELERKLNLSFETHIEALVLKSGLYHTFATLEKRFGREQLIARLKEKSDDLTVKYELDGVGKAELILLGRGKYQMPVTMIRLNSGRYIVHFDISLYDPEAVKNMDFDGLPQVERDLEIKLRSIMKGLTHGIVSQLLIFGKKGGPHIPLYKRFNPDATLDSIQAPLIEEIQPLADRYIEIEDALKKIETTDKQYEVLLAEREVLEETVLKLQKNKRSFWGRTVQSGVINLMAEETQLGQPVTVVYNNQGNFVKSENIERPNEDTFRESLHKWATYFKAIHESIHIDWESWYKEKGIRKLKVFLKGDLFYQYLNTPWQVGLGMASGYLLTFVTDNAPNWAALGMNSLFLGLVIGLNIRTFLNWSLSGTELSKSIKDTGLGILFGLSAYMFDPSKSLFDITLMTWAAMVGSQFLKNLVKKGPREYQAFLKRSGQTRGEYATPIEKQTFLLYTSSSKRHEFAVHVPFKFARDVLERAGFLRVEKVGEIPREIKKESILSTDMIIKNFIAKTVSTYSILLFPVYAMTGPYWERRSLQDKEAFAQNYAREHGAHTPKAKEYFEEAKAARRKWENYTLLDKYTLMSYGLDVSKFSFFDSKLFQYGIVVPSQYIGYYVSVFAYVVDTFFAFFSKKPIHRRVQEYVGISMYQFKVRQREKDMRRRNIINMNYPLQRETPEQLRRRRTVIFEPANCAGYFR